MSIFRIFFFTFKFRTVNNAGFWLAKNSSPRCQGKYDQRVTAKVFTYQLPQCSTSCNYERWCRKHGFLDDSVKVGRLVFFSCIILYSSLHMRSVKLFLRYRRLSSISGLFLSCLELRKKARQLENEIDLKLVSFSKLGTSYSHHNGFRERCLLDCY